MKNGFSPERAMAAAAHGVDLSVNIDQDLHSLGLAPELAENVRSFLEDAFEKRDAIGYWNALEQVKRMLGVEDVKALVKLTSEQILSVLDNYRQKAPYENGPVFRRI